MATATVLVVDNEPDILKTAGAMLVSSYNVLTADSVASALKILYSGRHVDLVLSEATLPGQSGSELIRSVQQAFPSTAVMLMNAYTEEALDPAVPCVQKPFTADTLISRVCEVLAHSRAAQQALREAVEQSSNVRQESAALRRDVREAITLSRESRWKSRLQGGNCPTVLLAEDDPVFRYTIPGSCGQAASPFSMLAPTPKPFDCGGTIASM